MYIHAERLLAKSGGSKAQWGGVSPTRRARESSDFSQKNYAGNPLRRAWGRAPSVFVFGGGALRGGWTSLLRWVAEDRRAGDREEETPPIKSRYRS